MVAVYPNLFETDPELADRHDRRLREAANLARVCLVALYEEVRSAYADGLYLEHIRDATGISVSSVHRIVTGKRRAENRPL